MNACPYDFSKTGCNVQTFLQNDVALHNKSFLLSLGGFCLISLNFIYANLCYFGYNLPHLCKFLYSNYVVATGSLVHRPVACPANIHWNDGGLDRDLYIQINELTVLAMDGRRRWLDIQKLVFVYCFFDMISNNPKCVTYIEEKFC